MDRRDRKNERKNSMHRKFERDNMFGLYTFWHGLNTVVESIALNVKQMGWDVKAEPVYFADGTVIETLDQKDILDGKQGENYVHHFLRATDDGLPVGRSTFNPKSYGLVTVDQWLNVINESMSGINHTVQTLGSVRNRGRLFCSLELPDVDKLEIGQHKHLTRLTFLHSFDMSAKFTAVLTDFDTVCDNTLEATLAFSSPFRVNQKHTRGLLQRIENMPEVIDQAIGVAAQFRAAMSALANTPCNVERAERIFAGFEGSTFKSDDGKLAVKSVAKDLSTRSFNRVQRLKALHVGGIGNDGDGLDDAYNAVTEYYGRESSGGANNVGKLGSLLTPDQLNQVKADSRWRQVQSAEFGNAMQSKVDFFNLIRGGGELLETVEKTGDKLLVEYAKAN